MVVVVVVVAVVVVVLVVEIVVVAGGAPGPPIATGLELIKAKRYRKPIGLLSTGILSTTEYRHTEYY